MGITTTAHGQSRQSHRVDDEILRMIARDRTPSTLTPEEYDDDRLTRLKVAEPCWAWVHYGDQAVRVKAEVLAYGPRAGAVRWRVPGGPVHRAWLWLNALEPREPDQGE
jgi:hypothetical protein